MRSWCVRSLDCIWKEIIFKQRVFLPVINNYSYDNFVLKACDKNILLMKYLVFSILQKRLIKSKRGTKGRNGTGTLTVVLKISRISMPGFIRNSVVGVAIAQTWSRKNEAKNLKGVGGGEKRKKKVIRGIISGFWQSWILFSATPASSSIPLIRRTGCSLHALLRRYTLKKAIAEAGSSPFELIFSSFSTEIRNALRPVRKM